MGDCVDGCVFGWFLVECGVYVDEEGFFGIGKGKLE